MIFFIVFRFILRKKFVLPIRLFFKVFTVISFRDLFFFILRFYDFFTIFKTCLPLFSIILYENFMYTTP